MSSIISHRPPLVFRYSILPRLSSLSYVAVDAVVDHSYTVAFASFDPHIAWKTRKDYADG